MHLTVRQLEGSLVEFDLIHGENVRSIGALQILQGKRIYFLKLPLKTPSPVHMAHYFCLPRILSLRPLQLPKESPMGKETVETRCSGIGTMDMYLFPGLLDPLVLVAGPRSPRWQGSQESDMAPMNEDHMVTPEIALLKRATGC